MVGFVLVLDSVVVFINGFHFIRTFSRLLAEKLEGLRTYTFNFLNKS